MTLAKAHSTLYVQRPPAMGQMGRLLGGCLLLLATLAGADFVVEEGTVSVQLPLTGRGTYDMSLANFGKPIYGGTLRCGASQQLSESPWSAAI